MIRPALDAPISPLRQRLIDDMNMRRFSRETQRNYLRDARRLTAWRHSLGVRRTPRQLATCAGSRSSSKRTASPCRP